MINGSDKVEYIVHLYDTRNTAIEVKLGAVKVWTAREKARIMAEEKNIKKYTIQCPVDNWFETYESEQVGFYNWEKTEWSA